MTSTQQLELITKFLKIVNETVDKMTHLIAEVKDLELTDSAYKVDISKEKQNANASCDPNASNRNPSNASPRPNGKTRY